MKIKLEFLYIIKNVLIYTFLLIFIWICFFDEYLNYYKIFIIIILPLVFIFLFCYIKSLIDEQENPIEYNRIVISEVISEPLPIYSI